LCDQRWRHNESFPRPEATSGAADLSAPGDLSSSAASFARYLRAANIAPATLKTYAEAVRTLAGFVAAEAVLCVKDG
jgi:hypothetical protein